MTEVTVWQWMLWKIKHHKLKIFWWSRQPFWSALWHSVCWNDCRWWKCTIILRFVDQSGVSIAVYAGLQRRNATATEDADWLGGNTRGRPPGECVTPQVKVHIRSRLISITYFSSMALRCCGHWILQSHWLDVTVNWTDQPWIKISAATGHLKIGTVYVYLYT